MLNLVRISHARNIVHTKQWIKCRNIKPLNGLVVIIIGLGSIDFFALEVDF